jgi:hypothetical protein
MSQPEENDSLLQNFSHHFEMKENPLTSLAQTPTKAAYILYVIAI